MSALSSLTTTEMKLFFREPTIWVFALVVPPLLLIVFGSIPPFRESDPDIGGVRVIDLYAPILVAIGVAILAVNTVPAQFAAYRERGVLRRMRTTPVQPALLLGAQLIMFAVLSAGVSILVLAIGRIAFAVPLPANPLGYLIAYTLSTLAMLAIGLLVAAVAPTAAGASALGLVLFFPLVFFAGLWIPRESMPEVLRTVSDFTPLGPAVQSLQDAAAGGWPSFFSLAVLAGWTVVAGGLAARYFRWE
ncbi:ABC transporter permease [Microbacterium sp. RD1]|uniref:ABC transporter permease n=1 Tax=Microbacterium sp. RD1 TaxID=3457313 RepID=UPI003FA5E172